MNIVPVTNTLLVLLVFVPNGLAGLLDTWTSPNPPPTHQTLYSVVYGNGKFVAVGDSGLIVTSEDGVKWDQHMAAPQEGLTRLIDVVYGNGQFVAAGVLGFNEGSTIQTSLDGITWVQRPSEADRTRALAFGNGLFVAVGFDGIQSSADGIHWIESPLAVPKALYGVTYGNGQFVAVGSDGIILTSEDGMSWIHQRSSDTQEALIGITYGNGQFVAVGSRAHGTPGMWAYESVILTSFNGATWVHRDSGTRDAILRRVAFGSGQFVAVGDTTAILTSADGVDWAWHESSPDWLYGITYSNDRFLAVGYNGTLLQSSRIVTLSVSAKSGIRPLTLSLAGSTGFVYTIETSNDLVSWQRLTDITNTVSQSVVPAMLPARADYLFYRAYSR